MIEPPVLKPVIWIGSNRQDFRDLPSEVKAHMGYAFLLRSKQANIAMRSHCEVFVALASWKS